MMKKKYYHKAKKRHGRKRRKVGGGEEREEEWKYGKEMNAFHSFTTRCVTVAGMAATEIS